MAGFYDLVGPLVLRIDPETAHRMAIKALSAGLVPACDPVRDPVLETELWGRRFANPIGLAAGFDKNAEVAGPMLGQGFGFVEVGSVTPRPQPGNPKPRLFRLAEDRAVVNRMGFNNDGQDAVAARLARFPRAGRAGPVGVNLGKNKETEDAASDYVKGVRALAGHADYLVVNVSSPNTPGLRALQGKAALADLLGRVREALAEAAPADTPPLLLKVAPDLTDEDKRDIAAVVLEQGIDGLIATNTTIERPASLRGAARGESGGLSGRPLFEPSTRVLRDFFGLTEGRVPLIGVGGISSGADAYAKIRAGASLVQLYSAMVYEGPAIANAINRDLARLLKADGFSNVAEAVGAEAG